MTARIQNQRGHFETKLTKPVMAEALRRYVETDDPVAAIAAAANVHPTHLRRLLHGRPGYAEAVAVRRLVATSHAAWPARDAELRGLVAQGLGTRAISVAMGLSRDVIRNRVDVLGMTTTGRPGAKVTVTAEERRARKLAGERARRARHRAEPNVPAAVGATAGPEMPRQPVPFPPRGSFNSQFPVPRRWEQIVEMAAAEGEIIRNRDDLLGWNRRRRIRGDAPVCIVGAHDGSTRKSRFDLIGRAA